MSLFKTYPNLTMVSMMRTNSTQVDKACCSLPNQNIVVVQDGISTPHCHLFQEPEDLESFLKRFNPLCTVTNMDFVVINDWVLWVIKNNKLPIPKKSGFKAC